VPVTRLIGRVLREHRIDGRETGGPGGVQFWQAKVERRHHRAAEVAVVQGA
jgi:hypothetical protein